MDADAADELNRRLAFRQPNLPTGSFFHRMYTKWKDLHSHKWMFDAESLAKHMSVAGFVAVRQREFCESLIPEINKIEEADRVMNGAGICVEGIRPPVNWCGA